MATSRIPLQRTTGDHERGRVRTAGCPPREYDNALAAGATHEEVVAIQGEGHSLGAYSLMRESGAAHAEALAALRAGVNPYRYAFARSAGATHAETLEALVVPYKHLARRFEDYGWARWAGATHQECLAAANAGIDLRSYAHVRRVGLSHEQALELHATGIGLFEYSMWRRAGAPDHGARLLACAGPPNLSTDSWEAALDVYRDLAVATDGPDGAASFLAAMLDGTGQGRSA